MVEYIDREGAIGFLLEWAEQLTETYGKNDEYVKCLESAAYIIEHIPVAYIFEQIPAADVRPVTVCCDCKHFQVNVSPSGYLPQGVKREES